MTAMDNATYQFPEPPMSERWKAEWGDDEVGNHRLLITGHSRIDVATIQVYGATVEYERAYGITAEEHAELQTLIAFGQTALADYAHSLTREGRFQVMLRDTEYEGPAYVGHSGGKILGVIRPSQCPRPKGGREIGDGLDWYEYHLPGMGRYGPEWQGDYRADQFLPPDNWEPETTELDAALEPDEDDLARREAGMSP